MSTDLEAVLVVEINGPAFKRRGGSLILREF
jgi:hypothetical protein